jgi:glucose/mannose-6-phosphate isomerase
MNLDDPVQYSDIDRQGMLDHVSRFPGLCEAAWQLARAFDLPQSYRGVRHVVVLGMGGSAIGGALLQGLISEESDVPVTVVRGYAPPAFVQGPDHLVIACSYSGNTEETLSAAQEALERDTRLVAVTTGGQLADLALKAGFPLVRFEYRSQPRAALPYSFLLLAGLVWQLGLVRDLSADLAEAVWVMRDWQAQIGPEIPTPMNAAKTLAHRLAGHLPVVCGAGCMIPVAYRWKTQFNENAKHWAVFEAMPELNHNAVVGYWHPEAIRDRALVVMLRSSSDHARVQTRWNVMRELLGREKVTHESLHSRGISRLAQMLSLVLFGDYASCYLALLNEVDPTPVETIAFLKQRVAEVSQGS